MRGGAGAAGARGRARWAALPVVAFLAAAALVVGTGCGGPTPAGEEPATTSTVSTVRFPSVMDRLPEDTLFPVKVAEKYGFIDESGAVVIEPQFDDVGRFSEGLAPARTGDTWGYIDESGQVVLSVDYHNPSSFRNGRARVATDEDPMHGLGTYGFIDREGRLISPAVFNGARSFSEGLAAVAVGDLWGYIALDGRTAIAPRFRDTSFFSAGLAPATEDGVNWGYIGTNGDWVIPPTYSDSQPPPAGMPSSPVAGPFSQDRAGVHVDGRWHYIDTNGTAVSPQFDYALAFSEGLGAVMADGRWGYVDEWGEMVIAPQFEGAWMFCDGLAMVRSNGKYGYIDRTGAFVIAPQYDHASSFTGALTEVYVGDPDTFFLGDTQMYIDRAGNVVYEGSKATAAAEGAAALSQAPCFSLETVAYAEFRDGASGAPFAIKTPGWDAAALAEVLEQLAGVELTGSSAQPLAAGVTLTVHLKDGGWALFGVDQGQRRSYLHYAPLPPEGTEARVLSSEVVYSDELARLLASAGGVTPAGPTLLTGFEQEPPPDVGFILAYGVGAKNVIDTFSGTFTKDLVSYLPPSAANAALKLTAEQIRAIYQEMRDIGLGAYPPDFRLASKTPPACTPFQSYYLLVGVAGSGTILKELRWDDSANDPRPEAQAMNRLVESIRELIESTPEFKAMPPVRGGYAMAGTAG